MAAVEIVKKPEIHLSNMAYKERVSTNFPHISISELALALKTTLEDSFGFVRVRGEISGFRGVHSSGHAYFSLKDATARLDAVIWRNVFLQMRVKPVEGIEVIASGKISTFPGKSSYQIIVESIEPAGLGALMALLEARRRQFAEEGLFDAARKRQLPFLPQVVGVVTSPTGSVIRDILHRLADRFPVRVVLWPVRVQGEGSSKEIASAIRGLSLQEENCKWPRPQVLIVARGGGALEDLWSFNDEEVIRAAADCSIPVVSAVGHETDWTLIDYVADLRAPTPTAAAEMCVPVRSDLISRMALWESRQRGAFERVASQRRADLRSVCRAIPAMTNVTFHLNQRLDASCEIIFSAARFATGSSRVALANTNLRLTRHLPSARLAVSIEFVKKMEMKLGLLYRNRFEASQYKFQRTNAALHGLANNVSRDYADAYLELFQKWHSQLENTKRNCVENRKYVKQESSLLQKSIVRFVRDRSGRIESISHSFKSTGYKAILLRGFAVLIDKNGRVIGRMTQAARAKNFTIKFSDGELLAAAVKTKLARPGAKPIAEGLQEKLF